MCIYILLDTLACMKGTCFEMKLTLIRLLQYAHASVSKPHCTCFHTYIHTYIHAHTYPYLNHTALASLQGGDVFEVKLTYKSSDATRLSFKGTVAPATQNNSASYALPYTRGLYDVAYHVTISGTYTMQVMRYGKEVKGSPTNVVITSGVVNPAASTASGFGHQGGVYYSKAESAKTLTFTVTARDRFGNVVQQPSILNDLELTVLPDPELIAVNPFPIAGILMIASCMFVSLFIMYLCVPTQTRARYLLHVPLHHVCVCICCMHLRNMYVCVSVACTSATVSAHSTSEVFCLHSIKSVFIQTHATKGRYTQG
jgi:hypothetical protein